MLHTKKAFTMIEMVFVIVILGILAAIAIPKFAATRTDAQIAKGRSDISAIRSAIMTERQSRLIKGDSSWIPQLSDNNTTLFTGSDANHTLLLYGVSSGNTDGHWRRAAINTYVFRVGGQDCTFTYDGAGKFTLSAAQPAICDNLVN
ncbi:MULTISPECIES: prepilin-type N-terminal cleavage/methylation domain-containing protein [Sulfurimonas]|uniref:prepilin-type N-terminal cleavage/methylation domain-containing protein n=1 Tax=Sulfurimonas TaxID=202746 RepID=UPI00126441C0|nr:prepilin-type N-terminal cleavage/methylation domain-containing protein [Sulfurimonas indica]